LTALSKPLLFRVAFASVLCALPSNTYAQQSVRDALSFLLTNQSILTDDFTKDAEAAAATRETITRSLLIELATLPIAASTGGFTYRLNPTLGIVDRVTDSFGPFFVERALTSGRRQVSFGATFQYARFIELDGNDLRGGTFVTTANQFRDEARPFDVEAVSLKLDTRTVTLFANAGVTDRLDVGIAVPIVALRLSGERVNTYRGRVLLQSRASASRTALGDLAVRARYHLVESHGIGVAYGTEVRLPTGREEDLLGAGDAAVRVFGVASAEGTRVAGHVNGGYTWGGVSREVSYGGAVTLAATAQFTLVGELLGRTIERLGRITPVVAPHPRVTGVNTIRLLPSDQGTTTGVAVAGFKWNVGGRWLINGNAVIPLTDRGLRARIIPTIALDYSWEGS